MARRSKRLAVGLSCRCALEALIKTTPWRPIPVESELGNRRPLCEVSLVVVKLTGRGNVVLADFVLCLTSSHSRPRRLAHTENRAKMTKMLLACSVVQCLRRGSVAARAAGHPSAWLSFQTLRHLSVKVRRSLHHNATLQSSFQRGTLDSNRTKMSTSQGSSPPRLPKTSSFWTRSGFNLNKCTMCRGFN